MLCVVPQIFTKVAARLVPQLSAPRAGPCGCGMPTGTRLLLRTALRAPSRAGSFPAAAAAASALVRCRLAASPAVAGSRLMSDYASRKETRQGSSHLSFWERWEKASAGEFHQGVGFDQDKKNDERFRMKMANQALPLPLDASPNPGPGPSRMKVTNQAAR